MPSYPSAPVTANRSDLLVSPAAALVRRRPEKCRTGSMSSRIVIATSLHCVSVRYMDFFMSRLFPRRIAMVLVSTVMSSNELCLKLRVAEYTPQSYRQDDLNMFAQNFSSDLFGVSPVMYSIDGGMYTGSTCWPMPYEVAYTSPGVLSTEVSFDTNGESDLDLEYAMNLVTSKQNVSLYQVGDLVQGLN